MEVLNPYLYRRLLSTFGRVKIANPGIPARPTMIRSGDRTELRFSGGEEYHVCCPFCGDRRFRLYINHSYGTIGESGVNDYAAICFNEDCLSDPENRQKLFDLVINQAVPESVLDIPEIREENGIELPEGTVSLLQALNQGREDAVRALRFVNETVFSLEAVLESYEILIGPRGQIIAPVRDFQGNLRAYQEVFYWKPKKERYRSHGRKSGGFYRGAVRLPFLILVEGVKDAWAIGHSAWAALGSSLSPLQIDTLAEFLRSENLQLIVMFDPDALDKAEELARKMKEAGIEARVARLPEGTDPAELVKNGAKL